MEITCSPMRLYVEPIRLILQVANIIYNEKISNENPKRITVFNESCCSATEYDEVIDCVNSLYFRSQKWGEYGLDGTHSEEIALNNKLLSTIKATYLELSDAVASEKSLAFFSETSIREYVRLISKGKFLAGDVWTPVDAFFYEIIKLLEVMNLKPKDSEIYKYIERIHAMKDLKFYIFNPDTFKRPYTHKINSTVTTASEILQKKLSSLCYFAMCDGMMMASRKNVVGNEELVEFADHMPFNGLPKRVSKEEIQQLKTIQQDWNILLNSMARDFDWYSKLLEDMIKKEDFVRRLYEIAKKCREYPFTQKTSLVVSRNDYMYNSHDNRWLQVEYNMIAAGLLPSADSVKKLQKHVTQNYFDSKDLEFEKSDGSEDLGEALLAGFNAYGNKNAIALIIVPTTFEANMFDQRRTEKLFFENGVECLRLTLEDVYNNSEFDESNGKLFVKGHEVGIIYFRAGYIPDHYPNEKAWKAREFIEMSQAIKCPNIDSQLINFKIFQVYLAKDEVLQHFVPEIEKRRNFQKNFAKFWDFEDSSKIPELLAMVEADPTLYVLKPQREGGANNYFNTDIITMMKTLTHVELSTYLLMEKIDSAAHIGYFIRNKKMTVTPCTSELGVFAYVLSNSEKIIQSKVLGTLVRSKPMSLSEGGLAAGYGVIDSFALE